MTAPAVVEALRPVLDALEQLGVAHFVTGSLASAAHGVPRASIEADVVADLRPEHAETLCRLLEPSCHVPVDVIHRAIAGRGAFNVIHLGTMVKVYVFVAGTRVVDRQALARARPVAFHPGESRAFPTASPEDTVLAKLEWFRKGGEASGRQWADAVGVLRASGPSLDSKYLRAGALEIGVADLLERALEQAAS